MSENASAMPHRWIRGRGQRLGSAALLLIGVAALVVAYFLPLVTATREGWHAGDKTYALANMGDYDVPGVIPIAIGAILLVLLIGWVIWRGESRAGVFGVVVLAAVETVGVMAVTAIGIYLLPNVHTSDAGRVEVSFGPALFVLVIAVALIVCGAAVWLLQVWTDDFGVALDLPPRDSDRNADGGYPWGGSITRHLR